MIEYRCSRSRPFGLRRFQRRSFGWTVCAQNILMTQWKLAGVCDRRYDECLIYNNQYLRENCFCTLKIHVNKIQLHFIGIRYIKIIYFQNKINKSEAIQMATMVWRERIYLTQSAISYHFDCTLHIHIVEVNSKFSSDRWKAMGHLFLSLHSICPLKYESRLDLD